jgi:hypothetical protein
MGHYDELGNETGVDWYYIHDEDEKLRKRNKQLDAEEVLRRRQNAIEKYNGKDKDRDYLNDGTEIEVGTHDLNDRPLHKPIKRFGPSTPGSAYVGKGGIQFNYDNSIIDLNVRSGNRTIGGVHKMKEPKTMRLDVDFGHKHNHINTSGGFKINLDVHPERHRLNTDRVKPLAIKGVLNKMNDAAKSGVKQSVKQQARKNKDDIDDLSSRLSHFVKKQNKKSGGVSLGAGDLDFSHVGITKELKIKKNRGVII